MSDDWKVGYKKALMSAFARSACVLGTYSYYSSGGGLDYRATQRLQDHLKSCEVDLDRSEMPTDSEWVEFMGTFYEGDDTQYGLDATVSCTCGELRDVVMRLRGSFSELLLEVLRED